MVTKEEMKLVGEECFKSIYQIAYDYVEQKKCIMDFLEAVYDNLVSTNATLNNKFLSILIFSYLLRYTENAKNRYQRIIQLYSLLSNHKLLKHWVDVAHSVDPLKPIDYKGSNYFPGERNTRVCFVRAILELILTLSNKFPTSKNGVPSNYKRYYDKLVNAKVVFPIKLLYFDSCKNDTELSLNSRTKQQLSNYMQSKKGNNNYLILHKIHCYIMMLRNVYMSGCYPEIRDAHFYFNTEKLKFETDLSLSEGEHNAELDQLKTFLNEECKMYDKYITVKKHDYQTYVDMMRAFSERWEADSPFKLKQNQSQNSYEWEKPKKTHSCLQRLSTIKENPQTSFKNINILSHRETKSKDIHNTQRQTKLKRNGSSKGMRYSVCYGIDHHYTETLKEDLLLLECQYIYLMLETKYYSYKTFYKRKTTIISPSKYLVKILRPISKDQNPSHFRRANFLKEGILFKNKALYVRFFFYLVYVKYRRYEVMICFYLSFVNIGNLPINSFSVNYFADQMEYNDSILFLPYGKIVGKTIASRQQQNQKLSIVPLLIPMSLITLKLCYLLDNLLHEYQIMLPNSILKLASYVAIDMNYFTMRWKTSKLWKTNAFQTHKCFTPNIFDYLFPGIRTTMTRVNKTKEPCKVIYGIVWIMNKYKSLLRLYIREQRVIIELGMYDYSEYAQAYFRCYLYALHILLEDN